MRRLLLLALVASCGGDDDSTFDAATADAPTATPDAPSSADAALLYPPGPYGVNAGDVIADLTWTGFVDGADLDDDPFNDPTRTFALHEYWTANDPDAKVLLIAVEAGWCGACMTQAMGMSQLAADYVPMGGRFLVLLTEDVN